MVTSAVCWCSQLPGIVLVEAGERDTVSQAADRKWRATLTDEHGQLTVAWQPARHDNVSYVREPSSSLYALVYDFD
jgi:hypothetical protein